MWWFVTSAFLILVVLFNVGFDSSSPPPLLLAEEPAPKKDSSFPFSANDDSSDQPAVSSTSQSGVGSPKKQAQKLLNEGRLDEAEELIKKLEGEGIKIISYDRENGIVKVTICTQAACSRPISIPFSEEGKDAGPEVTRKIKASLESELKKPENSKLWKRYKEDFDKLPVIENEQFNNLVVPVLTIDAGGGQAGSSKTDNGKKPAPEKPAPEKPKTKYILFLDSGTQNGQDWIEYLGGIKKKLPYLDDYLLVVDTSKSEVKQPENRDKLPRGQDGKVQTIIVPVKEFRLGNDGRWIVIGDFEKQVPRDQSNRINLEGLIRKAKQADPSPGSSSTADQKGQKKVVLVTRGDGSCPPCNTLKDLLRSNERLAGKITKTVDTATGKGLQEAKNLEIEFTPTLIIDGRKVVNPFKIIEELKRL